jgi:hypothetical protein
MRTKLCELTCGALFGLSVLTGNAELSERLKVDRVAVEVLRPINSTSTASLSTSGLPPWGSSPSTGGSTGSAQTNITSAAVLSSGSSGGSTRSS